MRDDEAFLRAVIERPDDDLPRLVYADWLDEHGDPERAEFIRVQCEMAQARGDYARYEKLFTRSEQLLAIHRARWLGSLADLVEMAMFVRGFVASITLPAAAFLAHADLIWCLAPLDGVCLKNAWEDMDKLAASPHLGRIQRLSLYLNHLESDDIATLLDSPYLTTLKSLDLSDNRFHAPAVVALAQCAGLSNLRKLNLSGNSVTSGGVAALAASPHLQKLSALRLWDCNVGAPGVEALAAYRVFPELASLELADNQIGTRGVRALVHSTGLQKLKTLSVSGGMLSAEQKVALERRFGPKVCRFL